VACVLEHADSVDHRDFGIHLCVPNTRPTRSCHQSVLVDQPAENLLTS
jgi:hypothetical protein